MLAVSAPLKFYFTQFIFEYFLTLMENMENFCFFHKFSLSLGQIYLKTAVFENNVPSGYWKSELFSPSLSTKWDKSAILVPLENEESLANISIKVSRKSPKVWSKFSEKSNYSAQWQRKPKSGKNLSWEPS